MAATPEDVTGLLVQSDPADREVTNRLIPLLYDELRAIAHRHLDREARPSLCTTELVHEAFLRLADADRVGSRGRAYFFAAASRAMRRILVDRARRRGRLKRGGGRRPITLDNQVAVDSFAEELLDLDRALARFQVVDPRAARVVEYRFFGGMSMDEIAEATNVSRRTVMRDWSTARAWLYRALQEAE